MQHPQLVYTKIILINFLHLFNIFVYIFMQITCILIYYFHKRWMLKTQTYVSEFFFSNSLNYIFAFGDFVQERSPTQTFVLKKVHLFYHVNYTNHENGLKIDHLTILYVQQSVSGFSKAFQISASPVHNFSKFF